MAVRAFFLTGLCWLTVLFSSSASAVTVTDSRGEHEFDTVPERVVSISWAMTEDVIGLGIQPVGVADIDGYNTWVVRPAIPDGASDVGKRDEPSIEQLAALKPDVIILSNGQEGLIDKLEQIAPVLFFDAYNKDHDNAKAAREIFLELGRLFYKEAMARQKLDAMDAHIASLSEQLKAHFGPDLPQVTGVRFASSSVVMVYGPNAMSQAALTEMGFGMAMDQESNQWGIVQKKMTELSTISKDGILLYFKPSPGVEKLFAAPLWKAMPVARANRVAGVESTWSYGGALSIGYLAQAMTDALLTIAPQ
ncbi:ABC transporter substrate-binding protein [Marinobacter sp. V034]|uniref:ABC transporter substrate-binding protein n=1 Tax=Marinobacter sp. V034 TaxID=3459610 RepID=UPI0040443DE7